ncbi:hypothetical protein EYF80_062262 [Liparis tanakae]|uniref:Uncharacterized protein n=1 Tax=Liparis tanakae TaxID=230148 RepID=A0A4Z2EFP3_9TELE|nr:hypothetical protein EYF80_062262 [Liparis tanakae]
MQSLCEQGTAAAAGPHQGALSLPAVGELWSV